MQLERTLYICGEEYAVMKKDGAYELCRIEETMTEQEYEVDFVPVFRNKCYDDVISYAKVLEAEMLYGSADGEGYCIGNGRYQNSLVNELKGA